MTDIIWEDPPETALAKQARGRYKEFAAVLREHPKQWARLPGEKKTPESAKATALNIRAGRMTVFPKGEFEVVTEDVKIWVRYVGEDEQAPALPQQPGERASAVDADSGRGAMVRQWARSQGIEVADRGRLPQSLIDSFDAAKATPAEV